MVMPIEGKSEKYTDNERAAVIYMISRLYAYNSGRETKYNRNLNRYHNSGRSMGRASSSIWDPSYQSTGYNADFMADSSVQTRLNVIKSAIDTVTSKLSQARVRPFFDAVKGDYDTIKATRSAQIFFDQFFDKQKIYERAPETARSMMLFDGGHFWVDEENKQITPLPHWELCVNPYEVNQLGFRGVTCGMVKKKSYPVSAVRVQFPDAPQLKRFDGSARDAVCDFIVYYDLLEIGRASCRERV